jgi:hypothetical protein
MVPSIIYAYYHPQHIVLPFDLGEAQKPLLTNLSTLLKFSQICLPKSKIRKYILLLQNLMIFEKYLKGPDSKIFLRRRIFLIYTGAER